MTPQERKLIDELFNRLASLEEGPRDPDAMQAIEDGLQRAPNAVYPLVQTALVQDEALKRADARIRELEEELDLEPGEPVQQPGFLDSMRNALTGQRSSVPSVRPGAPAQQTSSAWGNTANQPGAYAASPQGGPFAYSGSPGGSFLGTAAATVAGVVGGALLMNSFRGMFGGAHAAPASAFESGSAGSPWGSSASGSEAARDAGINDIGSGSSSGSDAGKRAGLFDASQDDTSQDDDDYDNDDNDDYGDDADDGGFDSGGDGGSDTA